jgi:hypothetical protein
MKGRTVNIIKAWIAKWVAAVKSEPVVTAGTVVAVLGVFVQWLQTNQITTVRQLVTAAAPIVVAFITRTFVTPNTHVALTVAQANALKLLQPRINAPGVNTPPPGAGTPPS